MRNPLGHTGSRARPRKTAAARLPKLRVAQEMPALEGAGRGATGAVQTIQTRLLGLHKPATLPFACSHRLCVEVARRLFLLEACPHGECIGFAWRVRTECPTDAIRYDTGRLVEKMG
jgi:hypothetical protein